VQIDGTTKSGWAYDLNVTRDTRSYTVDASRLTTGTHTLTWQARDVAGHVTKRSMTFTIRS
jgi:methionine-rich copper-binding protein CopC